ncbi:CLUMA_CG008969, isoform A [Clunio marinus]|uniref:CLUMA_CG008969, isoform A n=1 Tax=Clunio marinus TaxID=568069 RepID=A0A1J1I7E2_9DIPT|nr:CLUMA_CG008969, isoform A [Clunio marinus]
MNQFQQTFKCESSPLGSLFANVSLISGKIFPIFIKGKKENNKLRVEYSSSEMRQQITEQVSAK